MVKKHPRKESLRQRHLLEKGLSKGIVTPTGMIAFGRGEAFDYFLGEKTTPEAKEQIEAAAAMLLLAENPIISVNGNVAMLAPREVIQVSHACGAKIEANVFYEPIEKRKKLIAKEFSKFGEKILAESDATIKGISSARKNVSTEGIYSADVVLVMLEDGDRTEALRKAGKKVIAIDLNPKSRTAKKANITIVDNVVRALPLLAEAIKKFSKKSKKELLGKIKNFNNVKLLKKSESRIRQGLG